MLTMIGLSREPKMLCECSLFFLPQYLRAQQHRRRRWQLHSYACANADAVLVWVYK